MNKRSTAKTRTRSDTYVGENEKIYCRSCQTDLLYHEVTWWSVYDSVKDDAVYIDNRDEDDGVFTCECKGVTWELQIGD